MNDEKVITELKSLLRDARSFKDLKTKYQLVRGYTNETSRPLIRKWEYAVINIIKLRFGDSSDYLKQFKESIKSSGSEEYYHENVRMAAHTLSYIIEALEKGFTQDLFFQHEMELFGDMLVQAFEFLKKDLRHAAAIYGRIILELSIIEYANKSNINTDCKFDEIIIELRKQNIIHSPFENSLRANYKLGSLAAHGDKEFDAVSNSEIKDMLNLIRDKVLTLS